MADAAPTPGEVSARPRPAPAPDVFSERVHTAARWALPVLLGLVYGYWAAANRRGGGPITGWNVLFGFVCALAFAVLYVAVRAVAPRLKREPRALLWFVFTGCACGFLVSQSGRTAVYSTVVALAVAAGFFVVFFYRYSTHGDAQGRSTG